MQYEDPRAGASLPPPARRRATGQGLAALPRGLLVFPFLVAAGLTLVIAVALQQRIDAMWTTAAIAVGVVAAVGTLGWAILRGPSMGLAAAAPPPASRAPRDEAEPDPLANIHAVEAQGRRHRRPCPNCGTPTGTNRDKCPNCGHHLMVDCKGCRTRVRLDWGTCPECGRELP